MTSRGQTGWIVVILLLLALISVPVCIEFTHRSQFASLAERLDASVVNFQSQGLVRQPVGVELFEQANWEVRGRDWVLGWRPDPEESNSHPLTVMILLRQKRACLLQKPYVRVYWSENPSKPLLKSFDRSFSGLTYSVMLDSRISSR